MVTIDAVRELVLTLPRSYEDWVVIRLAAIDKEEMREIVLDAWRVVVPKSVAAEHLG